jgi:23S rRNA U2552 (ribose-2'-O)-methylase RlmE/FtsJ
MQDLEQQTQDQNQVTYTQEQYYAAAVQALTSQAWTVYNKAFHSPDAEPYREAGRDLYRQVTHERILAMFTKSEEQNRIIDSHMPPKPRRRRKARVAGGQ